MVLSSCSFTWTSPYLSHKLNLPHSNHLLRNVATSSSNNVSCAMETTSSTERHCQRRPLLLGIGALAANLQSTNLLFAEDTELLSIIQMDILTFIPRIGRAHDSAFKDRYLQLQNVRVRFIPTEKNDIRDLGPMEEVVTDLVKYRYTAPNQRSTIYDMQERTIDGKHYYTVEYVLASRGWGSASFATLAIGNGRSYTLIVGANERRWKKVRNQLKVVADSFRIFDI
ncbi:psbP-like protein 2 chloroplastic-like [Trifolium pratense]|uniref:PsbP-like protein 2 chloroplastic-like n=1 Tax=Trifolium pratense TaxID=57577 RepID=A0A2K3NL08_TRIPR|nr:psbP-like protein 2 chloroplastic-like [Trifolium pratense]